MENREGEAGNKMQRWQISVFKSKFEKYNKK